MFDYEKFTKELNEMAFYVLQCFKREYGSYLSTVKQIKLEEMLKLKKIVVLDEGVGNNLIHINPSNERFQSSDFKGTKQYYLKNIVIPDIFKMFITTNISRSEYKELNQPNLQQEFSIYLRNGFISYILLEFCNKYRLDLPDERNKDNLDFVNYMQTFLPDGRSFKELIFYHDYISCMEQVFFYSGMDLLEIYTEHLAKRKKVENVIKKVLEECHLSTDEITELLSLFKNKSISEFIELISKKIRVLCKDNITLQNKYIMDINLYNNIDTSRRKKIEN